MLKALLGDFGPTASYSGQTLVLSLPDALRPAVWTLDLQKDGHGSLSLEQDAETGEFALIFQGTKKNAEEIEVGRYREKAKAVKALMVATQALESAAPYMAASVQGENMTRMQGGGYYAPQMKRPSALKQWTLTILGIFILVVLYFITTGGPEGFSKTPLGQALRRPATQAEQAAYAQPQDDNPPASAIGVPMDADSFFEGMDSGEE